MGMNVGHFRYPVRIARLVLGIALFAVGVNMTVQAHLGLAPWDAFSIGIADRVGSTFGIVTILSGAAILVIDLLLREKLGVGTVLNTILMGVFLDVIIWLDFIPRMSDFLSGLAFLLAGQVVICVGSYYYIGAGLGCGPRDALMVAVAKRLPRVPVGAVRGLVEGGALLVGWSLGARVGVGTVIFVFGISFILQAVCRILRFDIKGVEHEGFIHSLRAMTAGEKEKAGSEARREIP